MRLHFQLSPNTQPVYFDYPHFLTGCFHRWIGENALHDGLSLYSLGWLQGGRAQGGALQFGNGARWFISAPDTEAGQSLLNTIAGAALQSRTVCCGMEVQECYSQTTPDFGPRRVFSADSPVFVRGPRENEDDPHLLWDDLRADVALTQTLRHKLELAGLGEHAASVQVAFDRSFRGAKTRLIDIKGFKKRANVCPVIVQGTPEAVKFAWNVGAGNLTGCCFGSLV